MYLNTPSKCQITKQKILEQLMNKELEIIYDENATVYFKVF